MAVELIDYAWGRPDLARVKTLGRKGVIRYLTGSGGKALSKPEIAKIKAAGLTLTLVYETTGRTVKGGRQAGVADAAAARGAMTALGLPASLVYFAVDYDMQPGEYALLDAYLDGAASVIGKTHTGVYAGYGPCAHAIGRGYAAWQTYAWSHGRTAPGIRLYQYANGQKLAGGEVDFVRTSLADYGQVAWQQTPAVPATPAAKPTAARLAVDGSAGPATIRRWQQVMGTAIDGVISGQINNGGARPNLHAVSYGSGGSNLIRAVQKLLGLKADGLMGPATIKAIQRRLGLKADGLMGPATVKALQNRLNTGRF
jgi:peptidoglycan hydrolase-like protein with peptidoglycan-binding domain